MMADPFTGLFDALRQEGVTLQAEIDPPSHVDGEWWADLVVDGWATTVSWRPTWKFGVYTSAEEFGFKPDEVYAQPQKAALRLLQLRQRAGLDADLPAALTLKDVRQLNALSQEVVAERLNKGQAEVSRLEAREDAKLSTIDDFVRALGGTLEIIVRFDDFAGPLALRSQHHSSRRPTTGDHEVEMGLGDAHWSTLAGEAEGRGGDPAPAGNDGATRRLHGAASRGPMKTRYSGRRSTFDRRHVPVFREGRVRDLCFPLPRKRSMEPGGRGEDLVLDLKADRERLDASGAEWVGDSLILMILTTGLYIKVTTRDGSSHSTAALVVEFADGAGHRLEARLTPDETEAMFDSEDILVEFSAWRIVLSVDAEDA